MLSSHVSRYVDINRRLGLKFDEPERNLKHYAKYAEARGDLRTNVERIYEWCGSASTPALARRRFETIRRFCLFLNVEDRNHEVPPAAAFGSGRLPRPAPYILEPDEIRSILRAALELPPRESISPYTYHYLFGLLAATGLRISEALALRRDDVTDDGLVIHSGKFGKSRLVPVHHTVRDALSKYTKIRNKLGGHEPDLFVVTTGKAPHKVTAHIVFVRLVRQLGIRGPKGTRGARLHDLRHTFAVRSLETCAHDRNAVARHVAALSTYLGHVDVSTTYWYLQATPVLMHAIADANEEFFSGGN